MKIEINPSILEDFNQKNRPATLTIGKFNICFNVNAKKILALEKGKSFKLEFEDGHLYYRDSKDGFTLTSETPKMLTCACAGIGKYIASLFKMDTHQFKFTVGEFIEGRRELITM